MNYTYFESPLGPLLLAGEKNLEILSFHEGKARVKLGKDWVENSLAFMDVQAQLEGYFKGRLKKFDLALELSGTGFQKRVWKELEKVPYGTTVSYGELAKRTGNPKACRAVGMANGKNSIPIVIPCHRVIGKDGSLTGFSSGLDIKKRLLELEKQYGA